jgi:DNA-binding MarR family transcriptional regulator
MPGLTARPGEPAAGKGAERPLPVLRMPGHFVRRLQQVAVRLFTEELADADITPLQYASVLAVSHRPRIEQAALSALIAVDRATIGGVIDRLEAKGWLERSADPEDRRLKRLTVTSAGVQMLREVTPAVRKVQSRLLEPLAGGERRVFERLCLKMLAHHE